MRAWKTSVIAIMASISVHANAEPDGSYEKSMMMITLAPTFLLAGTTGVTLAGVERFKEAKPDALAFMGSDGEIRGAQFEQAVRYYRTHYTPPLMSDQELAHAIAASF